MCVKIKCFTTHNFSKLQKLSLMANIPSEFIDQLLDRIDIIDVISPRVNLKKAGKDYQALCPFHTENTPSFTVSQNKQFYHCFGCGKHGSAIGFLMEFEGMEFIDSIETLAQSAGMEIPNQGQRNYNNQSKNLFQVVEHANRYFLNGFKNSEFAQEYIHNRGISKEVSALFQIGYAEDGWDGLLKRLQNHSQDELMKSGLIVQKDSGKIYDKFRGRIMFPIQDRRGRVIAFGGRAVLAEQKPKYLNSPETPLFHKGKELYGLNLARKHSNSKSIIVVEGYMDVIALHQAGFKNAVATLGTATSETHLITLLRSYEEIIFCFDGDNAGTEAAWKALQISLPVYRDDKSIRFLFLPAEHDPDTYVKEFGYDAFQKQLDEALTLSHFLLNKLKNNTDLNSIDGRAMFIEKSKAYVQKLPKGQFRQLLMEEVSKMTKTKVDFNIREKKANTKNVDQWTPIRKTIAILVNQPNLVLKLSENLAFNQLNLNGVKILTEIVDFCRRNPHISTAALLEHFREHKAYAHLSSLATVTLNLNSEQLLLELKDINIYFEKSIQKHRINELRNKQATNGLTTAEKTQLVELLSNQIK
ncbi:MAG TPA: DNA primase [Oceanospirillales bacterium]|nr:DNA primase [Oceanospirillales bacterium]